MLAFLKDIFKDEKKENALSDAKRAVEDSLSALKESRLIGHPCPDYGLKRSLNINALVYARKAMTSGIEFHPDVESALRFIVDVDRLEKQNMPIPVDFFKTKLEIALNVLSE